MNPKIKLVKIAPCDSPAFPTPTFEEYKSGQINQDVSIPVDYTVTGYLLSLLEEGSCLVINRETRNGEECPGIMATSRVTNFEKQPDNRVKIFTKNSVYILEYLD